MKEYPINYKKPKVIITKEEESILKISIEEYKELFPRILEISHSNFIPILEKYLKISLIPKNPILQSTSFNKIIQIIQDKYYEPEYEKINKIIQSISDIKLCETYNGKNFIPHCNNHCEPIHSCGNKMYILDNLNYLLCLKCHKIYHNNFILFYCSNCKNDYYTLINISNKEELYKPAIWEKYHCNAFMDDVMKCPNCKNTLYINGKNDNLYCLKCHLELDYHNIKWICVICNQEFTSAPKEYNPNESKLIKIIIKDTIFNGKDARPEFVPCCNLSKNEILNCKFTHKKECNGNLYEGEYNNKRIVVCGKCHMMNYYDNYMWMCPKCKIRFSLNKNNKNENEINNKNNNNYNNNINNNNNNHNNNNIINNSNNNYNKDIQLSKDKEEYIFTRKAFTHQKKINKIPRMNTSYGEIKKELNLTNINQFKKLDEFFQNQPRLIPRNRGISLSNLQNNKQNISTSENEKLETNKNSIDLKDIENKRERKININTKNDEITPKKLSNININLNVNVNINNKIPIPFKLPNSTKNISKYNLYNQIKLARNQLEENSKKFNLDDYNIISQIGEGTYGKIYQVEGPNKKKYALKKILTNSENDIKTIESEYKILNDLSPYNLNLVKIYGIERKKLDKTTYVMYVLMDLAIRDWEKEIIQRNQRKNYYSENELFQILKELIHTFSELQKHKISHRDIKPQNILLFNDNSFKIADFGEAKNLMSNNNTSRQTIRGTELYMSPILFKAIKGKNVGKYTEHNVFKSDVFSLGLCLLFAATLSFNSLCDIRELNDTISMKLVLMKYLKNRYSNKFTDILFGMLEIEEKFREDFIELDKRLEYL